MYDVGVACRN